MPPCHAPEPISTIARIERALLMLAYFIELDGEVHVPLYATFERELAALKACEDVKARAHQRLAAYRHAREPMAISIESTFTDSA